MVTKVKIYDRKAFKGQRPAGRRHRHLPLEKGVVRSPFVKRIYCDAKAAKKGTCG